MKQIMLMLLVMTVANSLASSFADRLARTWDITTVKIPGIEQSDVKIVQRGNCKNTGTGTLVNNTMHISFTVDGKKPNLTGSVAYDGGAVFWSPPTPGFGEWIEPDESVSVLHLVFMVHLDVGFTDQARNVCDTYFNEFFPQLVSVAEELPDVPDFKWTEFPWLIQEFLDSGAGCARNPPNATTLEGVRNALKTGRLAWQANAVNNFWELGNGWFLDLSLGMADRLRKEFGKPWGKLMAKSTDVPGMSQNLIPVFAKRGVRGIHHGFNGACPIPELPGYQKSRHGMGKGAWLFNWTHPESGESMITAVEDGYGKFVKFEDVALQFFYNMDNRGPTTAANVRQIQKIAKADFPNARVNWTSLDDFLTDVLKRDTSKLPVFDKEMGDGWLYGCGADPLKMSQFRHAVHYIQTGVENKTLSVDDTGVDHYLRRLTKLPEHNWGLSVGKYNNGMRSPNGNWSNAGFHGLRSRPDYAVFDREWQEQRLFAYPVMPGQSLVPLVDELQKLEIVHPIDISGWSPIEPSTVCDGATISFDPDTGAVSKLTAGGKAYAGDKNRLGEFVYRSYDTDDFNTFLTEACKAPDFNKTGMNTANPKSQEWRPSVLNAAKNPSSCEFGFQLSMDGEASKSYGAPQEVYIRYVGPKKLATGGLELDVYLYWRTKTATRLAEAFWMSFNPIVKSSKGESDWFLDVSGLQLDPSATAVNGTRRLHAVWGENLSQDGTVGITSHDVPLVGDSREALLRYGSTSGGNWKSGLHFNIQNNVWGTAFPQWYDLDGKAKWTLRFQ